MGGSLDKIMRETKQNKKLTAKESKRMNNGSLAMRNEMLENSSDNEMRLENGTLQYI